MSIDSIEASQAILKRGGSVNPANHPSETFELLSIPAFDAGKPEVLPGSEIGSSKIKVKPGDVLLSKLVPHIRRCWVVPNKSGYRQIASGEWIVFRDKRFDPNFLRHFLTSDGFHRQFMNTVAGVGGSLVRARPEAVGRIFIPKFDIEEQKRIATILDKADAIRRKRQQAIELADQFLRSVFLHLFGDPVTNTKGWDTRTIGDLCSIVRGSSPRPKGDSRYYGGPVPRLMVQDLTRDGKYVTPRIDSLTIEGAKLSRPIEAGTVVMAVSGNVGLTAILEIDACIHDGFIAMKELDESVVKTEFFVDLLMFLKSTHTAREAGAIFKNLTTTQIKEMEIPLPPMAEQKKYSRIVSQSNHAAQSLNRLRGEIEGLFHSLSQRAFAGEL